MSMADIFTGSLSPIVVLVLGAVVILLLAGPARQSALVPSVTGFIFAIAAGVIGHLLGGGGLAVLSLCLVAALACLLVPVLDAEVPEHVVEAAALVLLGTAGAIGLAQATDLIQAVVGLETLALSAVILVALGTGEKALEAAFKYFVLGAISLSGLLFGVGLIYLGTGSFGFPTANLLTSNTLVLAGVVLAAMGLGFELAIFPFHWGALDAYTAAVPSVAGFVMSASKLAAAFALGQLVLAAGLPLAQLLVWVGCLTIIWGTFGALGQAAGPLPTLIAVAGGVFSVLYYLRPLPDLFAALRAAPPARGMPGLSSAPAIALATIVVAVFGLLPSLVWSIAGH